MFYKPSKLVFILLFAGSVFATESSTRFVQTNHIEVKQEANLSAKKAFDLNRGDEVTVLETKDLWVKVKRGTQTGWTSKVFLSQNKPIGKADLSKDVPISLEKTSRRRSPSYTVNAAARGLAADEKTRDNSDGYKTDYPALKKMENRSIPPEEVDKFRDEASLPK